MQPWGSDGDKRRYFLIEGQDDTAFRVYRESNPAGTNRTWWSAAGSIDELKALAEKLEVKDGGPKARKLSHKMWQAIPRFEAGEDVSTQLLAVSKILSSSSSMFPDKVLKDLATNGIAETQAARVSTNAQRAIQAARAWILHV